MAGSASLSSFFPLVMVLCFIDSSSHTAVKGSVEAALRSKGQNKLLRVTFPAQLARRASPLNASAIAQYAADLEAGMLAAKIASFCREAGMICEEQSNVTSAPLHTLGLYDNHAISKNLDLNLFFGETKLFPGNWVPLTKEEEKTVPERAFLPRLLAEKLPFTRARLPELLRAFNFSQQSNLARNMAETLEICEAKPREDEVKACVTSMEAMADFMVLGLGWRTGIQAMSSSEKLFTKQREMARVINVTEIISRERAAVACHNAMFPYEVYYCHSLRGTKALRVYVETEEREEESAVVLCHEESKAWGSSDSQLVRVKRGELVCHWNSGDNLVWIPSPL